MSFRISKSVNGFSLIELMIVLALGSMAMMFMSSFMLNQKRITRGNELYSDFQSLVSEIQMVIKDPVNCAVTFAHPAFAYQLGSLSQNPIPPLMVPEGQGLYFGRMTSDNKGWERARAVLTVNKVNSQNAIATYGTGLGITQLQVQDWAGVAPNYYVNLFIQAQKYPKDSAPTATGPRTFEKKLPFQVTLDSSGKIVACGLQDARAIFVPKVAASSTPEGHSPAGNSLNSMDHSISNITDSILNKDLSPEEEAQVRQMMERTVNRVLRQYEQQ